MMEIEEVGNNTYRKKGSQETIYAPNLETAKTRFEEELKKKLKEEIFILQQTLYHKGFRVASDQLREIEETLKELL